MEYLTAAIILLIVLNLLMTVKVSRSASFEKTQKLLQIILIWVLPFIGAIAIYFFHKSDEEPKGPDKPDFGGGYGESGSIISGGD